MMQHKIAKFSLQLPKSPPHGVETHVDGPIQQHDGEVATAVSLSCGVQG